MLDFLTRKTEYLSDQFSKAKCTEILHICVKIFPSKISPIFSENISDINISHFSKGFFFPRNICHLIPNLSLIKSGIFPPLFHNKNFFHRSAGFLTGMMKDKFEMTRFSPRPEGKHPIFRAFPLFLILFPTKNLATFADLFVRTPGSGQQHVQSCVDEIGKSRPGKGRTRRTAVNC